MQLGRQRKHGTLVVFNDAGALWTTLVRINQRLVKAHDEATLARVTLQREDALRSFAFWASRSHCQHEMLLATPPRTGKCGGVGR